MAKRLTVTKAIRAAAARIGGLLQTIAVREGDAKWRQDDSATMELLLAYALGAEHLGKGHSGDMVLTGMVDLPGGGAARYIIDAKMDVRGRGRANTPDSGIRSKLQDLVAKGEQVIHATLWVNANGQVKGAGLFRFYEGFKTVGWKRMEPLTEVADMNLLATPDALVVFRQQVLARLARTDQKSYDEHVVEVAERFAAVAVDDVVLGYQVVEIKRGKNRAQQRRAEAATKIVGAKSKEEAAAKLLGISVEELRRRLGGGEP